MGFGCLWPQMNRVTCFCYSRLVCGSQKARGSRIRPPKSGPTRHHTLNESISISQQTKLAVKEDRLSDYFEWKVPSFSVSVRANYFAFESRNLYIKKALCSVNSNKNSQYILAQVVTKNLKITCKGSLIENSFSQSFVVFPLAVNIRFRLWIFNSFDWF